MEKDRFQEYSIPNGIVHYYAAFVGAGAAAPTVATSAQWATKANAASRATADIPTRSAAGVYTVTLDPKYRTPSILHIQCMVIGPNNGRAEVYLINAATRVISIKVWTAAGVALDLATTDTLVLRIDACDSNVA